MDYDTWISTNPADGEQEAYEQWLETNDDQLEGLNPVDIEALYEDFLNGEYYDEREQEDEDAYDDF